MITRATSVDTQSKDARPSPSAIALEVLAWALLAFAAASFMRTDRPTPLLNDSYQYLNVAGNFQHGRGISTSLIHFDTERSHGRIPAPLTTFPPGYPVVIALAGSRGNLETAARVVAGICFAGTAAFLAWAMIATGVTPYLRIAILLLFVTNAAALDFATSILTEPLYMLLSTGAVAGLIWAEEATLPQYVIARACLGTFVAGLAYWVRYAGLFLIAGVICYALLQLVLERNRLRVALLLTTLIPVLLAAGLMLRNNAMVGTWKGGNDMPVENPVKRVAIDYVRAQFHLLLGGHAAAFGVWEAALLVGGLGIAFLLLIALARRPFKPDAAALLVGTCVLVYSAGLFYAGLHTVISFGPRMFLPVLPLYLLLLGMGLHWTASNTPRMPWLKTALLLAAVGYAGVNARDLHEPRARAPHEILATMYAEPAANGELLSKWIDSNIDPGEVITATDGQATGYLLHRPILSLVGSHYSPERWECGEIRKQMRRFESHYLIVYKPPPTPDDSFLVDESRFVAFAVSGQPECGFSTAAWNADIRILKAE